MMVSRTEYRTKLRLAGWEEEDSAESLGGG